MKLETRLKQRRNTLKMTQEEVAEKIHVSRQTISNWENGRNLPDINSLILISEIYAISLDKLMKGDPKMVKKLDEKIKRGKFFYFLVIVIGVIVLLNILHLITIG
ncbi:possible transcriptional regulator [Carnobacterium sp. AT7]|uniref:helix-turn-helix domain-containing protein n=1 Tax=Carnobacterium TaxID=2747 RepID=UPI00015F1CE5|nr:MULTISPECIES: helix-turn-helix transcriptional regulator [Carnobacterium]EDP69096.1 possible transcriptional regulator [Carnobacterium sp. AT7]